MSGISTYLVISRRWNVIPTQGVDIQQDKSSGRLLVRRALTNVHYEKATIQPDVYQISPACDLDRCRGKNGLDHRRFSSVHNDLCNGTAVLQCVIGFVQCKDTYNESLKRSTVDAKIPLSRTLPTLNTRAMRQLGPPWNNISEDVRIGLYCES